MILVAQAPPEVIRGSADLATCLDYAMKHQPVIAQLKLNEEISRRDIGIALADWFPQMDISGSLQQYLKQPVSIFPDFNDPTGPKREITTGVKNTTSLLFSASQVIFNNDVFTALKSAGYYRLRSRQTTRESKISLVVQVSKAFYDVLLSEAKLDFLLEDQARLDKSMKDALSQYQTGVTDKIDYQRALISSNNIRAEILGTREEIKAKYAFLKELMGYPESQPFSVTYDSLKMQQDAWIDTTRALDYHNRIEYQLLLTRLNLQESMVGYYRMGFLPSLSAYANYNLIYQNDRLSDLYNRDFPNSSIGLRLSFPVFDGTRRIQQLKRASLQYREMALDTLNLRNRMNTEYQQALSSYKSNLKAFRSARENSRIAEEVYNTVKYQYDEGIKSYLEVIVSESDLRASRINQLNALYRLLSSKLDIENALGTLSVNE
jgi:outer membrane protein TolC